MITLTRAHAPTNTPNEADITEIHKICKRKVHNSVNSKDKVEKR